MNNPSFMKFRIQSPEHSAEVQRALFALGYVWGGNAYAGMSPEYVMYADKGNLFVNRGLIQTAAGTNDAYFDADPNPEYVLVDGEIKPASSGQGGAA